MCNDQHLIHHCQKLQYAVLHCNWYLLSWINVRDYLKVSFPFVHHLVLYVLPGGMCNDEHLIHHWNALQFALLNCNWYLLSWINAHAWLFKSFSLNQLVLNFIHCYALTYEKNMVASLQPLTQNTTCDVLIGWSPQLTGSPEPSMPTKQSAGVKGDQSGKSRAKGNHSDINRSINAAIQTSLRLLAKAVQAWVRRHMESHSTAQHCEYNSFTDLQTFHSSHH